ncbi:hypothetical protein [Adhaeribacter aquaticus]|uniref:hypothetical protein n=1 Tax=Adhaeribacter aquaticus TaxID=299567 RepID=UPI00041A65FC|nr:hypothetical protein [Adhaeribacter aquaticus]
MKNIFRFLGLFLLFTSFTFLDKHATSGSGYDASLVNISKVQFKNETYFCIYMKRESEKIKAKYFAASDNAGNTPYQRYKKWSNNKNMIVVSSGTYMTRTSNGLYRPEGLTIDNGVVVNPRLSNKFDGLVIVYNTGGIVVSNLDEGNLTLMGGGISSGKKLNLRKSAPDNITFTEWSKKQNATVFQTHLLAHQNKLTIDEQTSSKEKYKRRFLAVGEDEDGNKVHVIVQYPVHTTLYDGAKKVLAFLNGFKYMKVAFMVNLDTGGQDVLELFKHDGSQYKEIKGEKELIKAVNLLAYYYE